MCQKHDQVHNMIILECLTMYNVYVTTTMTHNQSAGHINEQRTICAGDECFLDENTYKEREQGVCQKHDQVHNMIIANCLSSSQVPLLGI